MSQQRTFTMQVRYNTDNPEHFSTIKEIMKRSCQEVFATLMIVAGSNVTKPDIKLFSDDFVMGREELDTKMKETEQPVAVDPNENKPL
jgi:hypothetical protein